MPQPARPPPAAGYAAAAAAARRRAVERTAIEAEDIGIPDRT